MGSGRKRIEVHGHRGCRGYLPENTIPAFLKAVTLGVDAIELDVVITGDKQVLVSHEAWFSSEICLRPDGSFISLAEEQLLNIYKLPYKAITHYDCGTKPHPRFPDQENRAAGKPLLSGVIDAVERYISENDLPAVAYNIEIKSSPEGDNLFHPSPAIFTDLLMGVLQSKNILSRTMIQSFDVRPLQELHSRYGMPRLGLLVENQIPVEQHLEELGFLPYAYNPHYSLLHHALTSYLKKAGIAVFTWTVNTAETVQDVLSFDVNGIITDYPYLVKRALESIYRAS